MPTPEFLFDDSTFVEPVPAGTPNPFPPGYQVFGQLPDGILVGVLSAATIEKPTHAHVSLSRLGGCNYRMPVTRKGRWLTMENPQCAEVRYRVPAEPFDSGKRFFRDGWCIRRWDAEAERITESEKGWQT